MPSVTQSIAMIHSPHCSKTRPLAAISGLCAGFLAMFSTASPMLAAAPDASKDFHPTIRVPQMAAAPKIDGKWEAEEWASATVFSGVIGNPIGLGYLLPPEQQVEWALGFREGMIYLAMRSHHPKGVFPIGDIKENDNMHVLWGDHVEVRFATKGRENVRRPYLGYYEMILNAWGAMHDSHQFNGTPDTEFLWSTGGEVACHVTDEVWEMEMSIKAANMGMDKVDGSSVVMQLVRADTPLGGLFYAGLVGLPAAAWPRFAEVTFDSKAPAVDFRSFGRPMEGAIDMQIGVRAPDGGAAKVRASLAVENAEGRRVFEKTKEAEGSPTASIEFRQADIPISEVTMEKGRNQIELTIESMAGESGVILFQNRFPFVNMTPEWKAKYLRPWLEARPEPGKWKSLFAHWPYAGKGVAAVDVDLFGVADEVRRAASVEVAVRSAKGKKNLGSKSAPLAAGQARLVVDLPGLDDGKYVAEFAVKGAAGKILGRQEVPFERKTYPFEKNQLGLSGEVIPPFLPIAVNPEKQVLIGASGRKYPYASKGKSIVQVWGRAYAVAGSGFFEQIHAVPPSGSAGGVAALLAEPIHLEVGQAGSVLSATPGEAKVALAGGDRALIEGSSSAGGLSFRTTATLEYDGWCEYVLNVEPATPGNAQEIESLDLVIDLKDSRSGNPSQPVDTLVVQRMGAGLDSSYHGGLSMEPGVVFESTSLGSYGQRGNIGGFKKEWHSFAPITYAGSGDRGLWFFAWSDAGWKLLPEEPMMRVERLADGRARMRVRLIAGPTKIGQAKKLRFAMQASPIKQNFASYRTPFHEQVMQDTSGYRYYGDSVDSYALHTEKDFDGLRKFLLYSNRGQEDFTPRFAITGERFGRRMADRSAPNLVLYGSQWMTGAGAPEFGSFAGEWLGANNWVPSPETKFSGNWNYGGTIEWNTTEELSAMVVNWPRSMVDFFLYYHKPLLEKTGISGTWWDNCYNGVITDFNEELGEFEQVWNLRMRRDLTKRLNVLGWELMRPPFWIMNDQVEMAWCQGFWLIEGFWGQKNPGTPVFKEFGSKDVSAMDFVRAAGRTKTAMLLANPTYPAGFKGTNPENDIHIRRGVDAMLLSHDMSILGAPLRRSLNYFLDYENTNDCLFTGYWASAAAVQPSAAALKVSLFTNAKSGVTGVLIVNPGDEALDAGGTTIDLKALNLPATDAAVRVREMESGREIKTAGSGPRMSLGESFPIPADDYRILLIDSTAAR